MAIGWGLTWALISMGWPQADTAVFYAAGAAWMFSAAAYLSYMRKARRELDDMRFGRKAMDPTVLSAVRRRTAQSASGRGFDHAA
jgi:hypothetical protein